MAFNSFCINRYALPVLFRATSGTDLKAISLLLMFRSFGLQMPL